MTNATRATPSHLGYCGESIGAVLLEFMLESRTA